MAQPQGRFEFKTQSDCEVILPMYANRAVDDTTHVKWINKLRGMFAFVLHDRTTGEWVAVRDHLGICPLYIGWGADGAVWIASEFKAIAASCSRFEVFPPGHVYSG